MKFIFSLNSSSLFHNFRFSIKQTKFWSPNHDAVYILKTSVNKTNPFQDEWYYMGHIIWVTLYGQYKESRWRIVPFMTIHQIKLTGSPFEIIDVPISKFIFQTCLLNITVWLKKDFKVTCIDISLNLYSIYYAEIMFNWSIIELKLKIRLKFCGFFVLIFLKFARILVRNLIFYFMKGGRVHYQ